jgi:hypothetical protein
MVIRLTNQHATSITGFLDFVYCPVILKEYTLETGSVTILR